MTRRGKGLAALSLSACVLLCGCGWRSGSYVYVEPHREQTGAVQSGGITAGSYVQLVGVLETMVEQGRESFVIDVGDYGPGDVEREMGNACQYIRQSFPMGAYAVEEISFEVGVNSGREAVAVDVQYRRSRTEIRGIRKKADMEGFAASVRTAMTDHSPRLVVLVSQYEVTDFNQLLQAFAQENPHILMEIPQISEGIYGSGPARVVELNFTYQNSRDSLRQMQTQVRPVFEAAQLYVSGEGSDHQKLSQLSGFLTERFDYTLETSITPSYSLLCHGVGDSRAFAECYAAMCRQAGLECLIVTGTREGEPRTWNIVKDGAQFFHVDLIRCLQEGGFREYTDTEMAGYVWDYSAYPVCRLPPLPETAPTEPADPAPETTPTDPSEPPPEPTEETLGE